MRIIELKQTKNKGTKSHKVILWKSVPFLFVAICVF